MSRRFHFIFFMGLLLSAICAVSAQEAGGWRKELEAFEKSQAKLLLPVHEILLSELSNCQEVAAKGSDLQLQAELEARVAVTEKENEMLKQGRVPHASRENDHKNAFLRAASGRQWTLSGTQRVHRVGLRRGGIRSFNADGHELGDLAISHLAPGVFGSKRRQDSGWTCFAFSADLQHSQCLIVSAVLEGVRLSVDEALPAPAADKALPSAAAAGDQTDLLGLLETRYRQKLLQHEAARRALIEDLIRSSSTPAGDLPELRGLLRQALAAHELLRQPATPPALEMETPAAFLARLQGSEWQISAVPSLSRLRFEGLIAHSLTPSGQVQETLIATLEWSGLLRLKPSGGVPVLLAFSPDLDRVVVLPLRSVFPGQMVQ